MTGDYSADPGQSLTFMGVNKGVRADVVNRSHKSVSLPQAASA